ncbi:hypothetical protein C823_003428 [Eubacterium plexicaudatum ASF492]|uniref:MBOAT family protein n=1 Tax=Eubacterium plexicaudatum ASF492 TaxID=1235802 RepID=N2AIQ0_9FIRM|nr:hypothetical protein C823_003428 [Eubacterium plexicaudatum ASF492]
MNFISMEFLIFFPIVLLICRKLPAGTHQVFILIVSYFFYMNGISWIGLLLFFSTAVSWTAARQIARASGQAEKKVWLVAVCLYCLICLLFFKRKDFLVPGISFYMFQALSYVLDVYGKKSESEPVFYRYALYVSFFPQLAAGPIERARDLLPQLKKPVMIKGRHISDGLWLMLRGFFKKLAVADYLAAYVSMVYDAPGQAGGLAAVIATLFFAVQIYCDFSGYTDIARGAARMLGIELMENFDHPYRAANMQEFWRRWHISLTKWLTDYLYIPLGGSRKGFFCTCRNRMAVFALSGLWHGLSWHYVVWGLLHGIFLSVWHITRHFLNGRNKNSGPVGRLRVHLSRFATFSAVCFAWIFFRAESLSDAWILLGQMFFHFMEVRPVQLLLFFQMSGLDLLRLFLVLLCLFLLEKLPDVPDSIRLPGQAAAAAFFVYCIGTVTLLSWLAVLAQNGGNTFIYFLF